MKRLIWLVVLLLGMAGTFSATADDDWKFRLSPNMWLSATSGDVTIGGRDLPYDASFSDIMDNLNIGGMVRFEAWKGDWGLFFDGVFMDLETNSDTGLGDVKAKLRMGLAEVGGSYRIAEIPFGDDGTIPGLVLEVMAGGRYTYIRNRFDLAEAIEHKNTLDWIDPMVGARIAAILTEELSLILRGDIGGFGIGSAADFTWNLLLGLDYRISKVVSIGAAYRNLSIDYERGSGTDKRGLDMRFNGPVLGVSLYF